MFPNVQQTTIKPVIAASVAPGTLIHTDKCDIHARLPAWGCDHKTVAWSDEASHHPGTRKERRWSRPAHRPFRERIPLQRLHLAAVDAKAGVCGHRAHADGSSARKAADFLAFCCGRR